LAATLAGGNNDNTIIGTPNAQDTISDGNGNDVIWGLGGSGTISVGNGDDMVDADGMCNGGYDTVTPGSSAANYCNHGHDPDPHGNNISAGSGNDTIFGGSGQNNISAGGGNDTIYGSPSANDTISAGPTSKQADDTIYVYNGSNHVTVGSSGNNVIHAYQSGDPGIDTIKCGSHGGIAYVNSKDNVTGCEKVVLGAARDLRSSKRHTTVHKYTKTRSARRATP
jgi:Ca2+-binding RTX toxin-like protein